ncbi:PRC and DUF2382 domain-containing protein [Streptomyces sp. DH24]|uniref:PRC and DUF2382 domain-containing protein n=1 Tax=Streptomyces sp. DH24 TaxID=3040123 RepID=UPI002441DA11|nr:PRC and DUF2382 domain-containing protein [Streptomyces sp. DH24]MDG9719631.1 PRC and DUF2382 domain-containing protein [Streptomyces sp. DH24]
MITREQIPAVLDHPVYDAEGNKVGEAKHVFLDDATGRPEWVTVKTGLFGTSESFVPIREADLVQDHLEVPYPKNKIKDAPHVDVDGGGHLSEDEEHRLYEYYGIDWDEAWQRANRPGEGGWAHSGGESGTGTAGAAGAAGAAGYAGTGERAEADTGMTEGAGTGTDMGERARAGERAGTRDDDAMTRSEERMKAGVERRERGHARLRKYVVTEEVEQTVPVRREEVRVEREPITDANRDAAMSGEPISEAEHEVTLHEERPVVETETVPVERVRLTTDERVEEETVRGQVRKERIDTEGDEGDEPRNP